MPGQRLHLVGRQAGSGQAEIDERRGAAVTEVLRGPHQAALELGVALLGEVQTGPAADEAAESRKLLRGDGRHQSQATSALSSESARTSSSSSVNTVSMASTNTMSGPIRKTWST